MGQSTKEKPMTDDTMNATNDCCCGLRWPCVIACERAPDTIMALPTCSSRPLKHRSCLIAQYLHWLSVAHETNSDVEQLRAHPRPDTMHYGCEEAGHLYGNGQATSAVQVSTQDDNVEACSIVEQYR